MVEAPTSSVPTSAAETTPANMTPAYTTDAITASKDDAEEDEQVGLCDFRTCGCEDKASIRSRLAKAKKQGFKNHKQLIASYDYLKPEVVHTMCWNHLRDFCTAVGLKTQIGGRTLLVRRIDQVRQKRYHLGEMKVSEEHRNWFSKAFRGTMPDDALGSLRFPSRKSAPLELNRCQIMHRYMGPKATNEWEEHGTTVVRAMGWLFDDPRVQDLISHEFNMYLHHRRMVNGEYNLGWLRSSYHSQIQQVAR